MRVLSISMILLIAFTCLIYYNDNPDNEPGDLLERISNVENSTFNLTQSFPYTSLYHEKPTPKNVIINIANGIIYAVLVEIHTLVPTVAHVIKDYGSVLGWIMIILLFSVLINIFKIIYGIAAFVMFLKERKIYDEKVWD